jgi:hypothetical protein
MKKKLLLILSVLTLLISLILLTTGVAGADSSQTWFLDGNVHPSETGNYLMIREGNGTPSGEVILGTGSSDTERWLSDETAVPASGVTFPAGTWTIYLHIEDITGDPHDGRALIGSYLSGGFVDFPRDEINGVVDVEEDLITLWITTYTTQTVPQDGYLALQLTNYLDIPRTILCDGISRVESPDDSPSYPLPEMATGLLLVVGMGGLGAFIVIRKKQTGVVNR